jgi:membrane protein
MIWLHQILLRFKPYFILVERTKTIILPGFSPLPLYTVASFFFLEIGKDELINKASSLAYSFMLAIFPAIIFLFTLIPYVPMDNFQEQLMSLIALVLPIEAYTAVQSTLFDIVKNQNSKLLSFGFVFALIFSTNGVHNLMEAFNKSSLIIETRSWLKQRLVALYLTLLILFALIFALIVMTIGEYI